MAVHKTAGYWTSLAARDQVSNSFLRECCRLNPGAPSIEWRFAPDWKIPMNTSFVRCVAIALVLYFGCACDARAQEPTDGRQSARLEELVITAQRREQDLQSAPLAVTAVSGDDLAQRQVIMFEQLGRQVPSLAIEQTTASPSTLEVMMRGVAEQNGGIATAESPVAIYIDDVYQGRLSASNMLLGDVERVEVLRGPQGTLYGRNSMAGAIRLITRPPDGTFHAEAEAGIGSYDEARFKGGIGGALGDSVGATISFLYNDRPGWQYGTALQRDVGDTKNYAVRGSMGLLNSGAFDAVLRASHVRNDGEGQYFVPLNTTSPFAPQTPGFGDTQTPVPSSADSSQANVSLDLSHEFNDGPTLRSITAYQDLDDNWVLDFTGGFKSAPDAEPVAGLVRDSNILQDQFTQELMLIGTTMDDRLHFVGGLSYFNEKVEQTIVDVFGPGLFGPAALTPLPTTFNTDTKSYAAYVELEFAITDRLTAIGGVRYTDDNKTFDGVIQDGLFGDPQVYAAVATEINDEVWTPKATLQFKVNDELMYYGTVARGYRAGSFNGLAFGDPLVFGQPYKPEYNWSYELGVKSGFWDKRAQVNAAVYYEELTDLQQSLCLESGTCLTQNASSATVKGLELEVHIYPTDGLHLFATGAFTDDEYDKLDPRTGAAAAGAERLPLVSRTQYNVGAAWEHRPAFLKGGALTFSADYAHYSSRYSEATNSQTGFIPSYGRANAAVSVESPSGHWHMQLAGQNVFDEEHNTLALPLIPGLVAIALPARPATFMVSVGYTY